MDNSKVAQEKIEKALTALVMNHPFFASKALKHPWNEDSTCKTGWTDGTQYGYNVDWISEMELAHVVGFEAHEVSHDYLNHNIRIFNRDHNIWNQACDKIINPMLLKAGFKLPEGALMPEHDEQGMYEEQLYDYLMSKQQSKKQSKQGKQGQGQSGQGGCIGEVRPFPSPTGKEVPTPAEIAQQEQAQNIDTQQAVTAARMAGNLPSGMERLIKDLLEPVIPWREVLARYVDSHATNDYTWSRPNPRYIPHGLYLPVLRDPELGHIGYFDDTSGSHFSQEQQAKALSELRGIVDAYSKAKLTVIFCDTEVKGEPVTIEAGDDVEVVIPHSKVKGGGGTCFKPPFKWIEEQGITLKAAIYITDGECDSFPETPEYDVLWILTEKNESFKPPFGEVITMRD